MSTDSKGAALSIRIATALAVVLSAISAPGAVFNIADGDVAGLVNAINASNTNAQDDTINLAPNGSYILTGVYAGSNGLPSIEQDGELLGRDLTIYGNNATIARSSVAGTAEFRILEINYRLSDSNALVTIWNTTFENGRLSGDDTFGGGISATGFVTFNNCTIQNNAAGIGGGVHTLGVLSFNGCTLKNNSAVGIFNGGGALTNFRTVTLTNCTFSGNTAPNSQGATLYSQGSTFGSTSTTAVTKLYNCTVQGGAIFSSSYTQSQLGNTILADCTLGRGIPPTASQIISEGFNLSNGSGNGYLTHAQDRPNTNPFLDPRGLRSNGGPTETIMLAAGSPAIDQGEAFGSTVDQRGFPRPVDNPTVPNNIYGSDIGAFETAADPEQVGFPSFVVTTTDDHNDGVCSVGDCTLREALQRTNATPEPDVITFAPGVTGTIFLQAALGGRFILSASTTITGPGARLLTISGNSNHYHFYVSGGSSLISGLTLANGRSATNEVGGSTYGGGIKNHAHLELVDCTLQNNSVSGRAGAYPGGSGGTGYGGAISNFGFLDLKRCTFKENAAYGGRGADNPSTGGVFTNGGTGGSGYGGAIYHEGSGLNVSQCTFSGNNVAGDAGGSGHFGGAGGHGVGGAIYSEKPMSIFHCTISGNFGFAGVGGGGSNTINNGAAGIVYGALVRFVAGTDNVGNTIIAANTGRDVHGAFVSSGYNLIGNGDFSSGFNGTGDQEGTSAAPLNARLGALQNNGGPTDTMALLSGSPALDQGKSFNSTTDQRGLARPKDNPLIGNAPGGDGSDIGAFEFDGYFTVTTTSDQGGGSLREALTAAHAGAGDKVIGFAPGMSGIIQLGSALPTLAGNITIFGPGAELLTLRRTSGGDYRIFTISNGTAAGPVVNISGLTLANGQAPGGSTLGASGGAILNDHGSVTLTNCAVIGNRGYYGGAICNNRTAAGTASLIMTNTTLADNQAPAGYGGAIYNGAQTSGAIATLALTNCTLTNNNAANGFGGAIYNSGATSGSAPLTLTNCTLAANNAGNGGGLYNFNFNGSAAVTLRNSIFSAGGEGANFANNNGSIASQGRNLSSDAAGGAGGSAPGGFLNATGDLRNTNPLLGPLENNGGPTPTHALLTGSPAINAANNASAPVQDQRGYLRIGTADIGAFEFGGINIRILSITRSGSNVVLSFQGVAGRTFRLERKPVLSEAGWQSITGVADLNVTATNGVGQVTDPGAITLGKAFYRVRLLP